MRDGHAVGHGTLRVQRYRVELPGEELVFKCERLAYKVAIPVLFPFIPSHFLTQIPV